MPGTVRPFSPGVVLHEALRIEETSGQRLAAAVVLDNPRFQIFDPDPFDPRRGAFQITRLFAVELNEGGAISSEEHTSELQYLMRISYAVLCLKNHKQKP